MTGFLRFFSLFFAINLIAGCVINTTAIDAFGTGNSTLSNSPLRLSYQGRLSLRIASDPVQFSIVNFTLSGNSQIGELTLVSPLGTTDSKLSWTPKSASFNTGKGTLYYDSANEMIETVTGTSIPLSALFDWLAGIDTPINGWEADLSNMQNPDNPRLIAKRISPLPPVELRIALEKQ